MNKTELLMSGSTDWREKGPLGQREKCYDIQAGTGML